MPANRGATELIAEGSSGVETRSISTTTPLSAISAVVELEPPWSPPPNIGHIDWEPFAIYPQHLAAHIVSGLLQNEGVPAVITAWTAFPGVNSAAVWVPKYLMHRARWICALAPPSDSELLFLATGELSPNEGLS